MQRITAWTIVILFRLAGKQGNDDSLTGGVIGAAVLVAINGAFNRWLAASPRAVSRCAQPRLGSAPTPLRQTLVERASLPRDVALARVPRRAPDSLSAAGYRGNP